MIEIYFDCADKIKVVLEGEIALGALITVNFSIRSFNHSRKTLSSNRYCYYYSYPLYSDFKTMKR